jgi:hypothetical protein
MNETAVVAARLQQEGWTVGLGPDPWLNLYATRGEERMHAEAR